jgi:hypothetical protein
MIYDTSVRYGLRVRLVNCTAQRSVSSSTSTSVDIHIESATLTRHISISLMLSVHYEHVMQMSRHATLYCITASSGTVVH